MPRLTDREHEKRDEARAGVITAVQGVRAAASRLDDAVAAAVDAGLSWTELSQLTDIDRRDLANKWRHRRSR